MNTVAWQLLLAGAVAARLFFLGPQAVLQTSPQAPTPPAAAQSVSPADQAQLKDLAERFYTLQTPKTLDAFFALWHPQSTQGRTQSNVLRATAEFVTYTFSNIRCVGFSAGGDTVTVRVVADVAVNDLRRKRTEHSTWMRTLAFRRESGAYLVWSESSTTDDFAQALAALPGLAEQVAALDAEPGLMSNDLRMAVVRQANRALGKRDDQRGAQLLELAVRVAERVNDPEVLATAWIDLGMQHQGMGAMEAALDDFNRGIEQLRAVGNTSRMAATHMNLARILYDPRVKRYTEAKEHYLQALECFETVGDTTWIGSILHSLGNTAYLLGDAKGALEYYRRTLEFAEKEAAKAGPEGPALVAQAVAAAYQAIGMVLKDQGDYPAAIDAYEKSVDRWALRGDKTGVVNARQAMGEIYRMQGDFPLSLRSFLTAYETAVTMRIDTRDDENEGMLLAQIGNVYSLEQRYRTAHAYFIKSLELQEKVKNRQGMAVVLGGIGGVHLALGEFDKALEHFDKSLTIRRELDDTRGAALTLAHIGLVHTAQENHDAALESFESSLEQAELAGDSETLAIAQVLIGKAMSSLSRLDEALEFARTGADIATGLGNLDILAQAKIVTAEAHRLRGDLPQADAELRQAIFAVERIRQAGLRSDERFFNDTVSPYMALAHVLVEQKRERDGFAMLEQARQVRMQALLGGGAAVVKGLNDEERLEERKLRAAIASLRAQVEKVGDAKEVDRDKLAALTRELAEKIAARAAFEATLYEAHPDLKVLRAKAEPDSLVTAAEATLDERTAILSFAVTETRTYVFVVTASAPSPELGQAGPKLQVCPIEIKPAALGKLVQQFRNEIAARAPEADASARALYDLLLAPVQADFEGKTRLLIVPDATLWALPFQALQPAEGRYLIQDHAVAYAASLHAAALAARADAALDARNGAAPGAKPAAKRPQLAAIGLASPGKAGLERISLVRPDLKPEPLLQAEREARSISALFAPARTRLHLAATARAKETEDAAASANVLHLAVPGILNDASPLHSFIALSPADQAADENGVVEMIDVLGWETGASLVVLSRMQGDLGGESAGAAARAASWAWLVAGTPTTVLSEWTVDAAGTTTMMRAFHSALAAPAKNPVRTSDALRRAILPVLKGPNRHPYFWSGFRVMGDAR